MKKLLAILGSIGLTSTAAISVVACGDKNNSDVDGDGNIVVSPTITNGSYNSDSKTFIAQYGSDKYQEHKMSFSLNKVILKTENILVTTVEGNNVDQEAGLWNFWISENGVNTVFEIEDSSLNGATIQINLDNHLSIIFKIVIHQDENIIVNNVINGSYNSNTTTFTAKYGSSQYNDNIMRFSLTNVSLSENNLNVVKSDGTKVETKDGLWSFVVIDNTTTIHIDDYHLNGATIQINLDGYNSITFKIVIVQDKEIEINNTVVNGSYNSDSKTFIASYRSAQYSDHKMSFTINDLTLNANNIVVKTSDGEVTTGWSLTTTTNTTTISLDDYHLNGATVRIQDVNGYWPVTFNVVINQDQNIAVGSVTNGGYQADIKTFIASNPSSTYKGHELSFALTGVTLSDENILVKNSSGTITTNGWSFTPSDENTTITINDYSLNEATIEIKGIEGYWPIVFKININQDKDVFVNPDVRNGKYDETTKTFTADYGSSKYDDNHLIFSLKDFISTEEKIVVKDLNGQVIDQASNRWSFWTADDGASTVIEIKDANMNGATIEIKGIEGYWPVTFNIAIIQDKHIVIEDIKNGKYDETTKTFTADYGSSTYQEENHQMSFKVKGLPLEGKDFVLVRNDGGEKITTGWSLTISGSDTIITINDYNLNNTKAFIQNIDGYWPEIFNVAIPQDQNVVVNPDVSNGKYDEITKTFTASYGNSTYQEENHQMSFELNHVLGADNIVVKNSSGTITTNGWSFTTSDENTTITISDYSLNEATIEIKGIDGYWPIVFNVAIPQDQNVVVNPDVSNGKYDETTKIFTADYGSDQYDSNNMYFSLYDLVLDENNIVVKDADDNVINVTTDRWYFWTAFDNNKNVTNTVFQIKDSKLNGATIEIKNVKGYWPVTFKIVIPQS